MPFPEPEAGLVIAYAYLWSDEARRGKEEGVKDRPCVIVLALEVEASGETLVTVLPITHTMPRSPGAGVEIPIAVKRHLQMDDDRSWVVVTEGDQFVWPGYDLRKTPGRDGYAYGFLPPRFFAAVAEAFRAWHRSHRVTLTRR